MAPLSGSDARDPPKDRFKVVLAIVCVLGLASLLPWNVLITQAEFLTIRTHVEPTFPWAADQILPLTANAYMLTNIGSFLILLPHGKNISVERQVVIPLCVAAAVVIFQAWVALTTALPGKVVIATTLVSTALLGAATAPLTSATYALASYLPPIYIQVLVVGQSLAGVVTSALSFGTVWRAAPSHMVPTADDVRPAAVQYFLACAAAVGISLAGYYALPHISFVQHFALQKGDLMIPEDDTCDNISIPILSPLSSSGSEDDIPAILERQEPRRSKQLRHKLRQPAYKIALAEGKPEGSLKELLGCLRGYHWVVGLSFLVSLLAYPSMTASICSQHNPASLAPCNAHPPAGRFYGELFQPFLFLLFNSGDSMGRMLAGLTKRPPQPALLFTYAGARLLLVVALAFCNVVTARPWLLIHFFRTDVWAAAFVTLLGFSNGHLSTLTMMFAPQLCPDHLRERCGTLMSFCLTLGLAIGSFLSIGVLEMLQVR